MRVLALVIALGVLTPAVWADIPPPKDYKGEWQRAPRPPFFEPPPPVPQAQSETTKLVIVPAEQYTPARLVLSRSLLDRLRAEAPPVSEPRRQFAVPPALRTVLVGLCLCAAVVCGGLRLVRARLRKAILAVSTLGLVVVVMLGVSGCPFDNSGLNVFYAPKALEQQSDGKLKGEALLESNAKTAGVELHLSEEMLNKLGVSPTPPIPTPNLPGAQP
jgi:hypothetical protein